MCTIAYFEFEGFVQNQPLSQSTSLLLCCYALAASEENMAATLVFFLFCFFVFWGGVVFLHGMFILTFQLAEELR